MGRGTGEVPVEVVLSFDRGEEVGKFERLDILPDDMEGSVDFRYLAIDPETVDVELAMIVVIFDVVSCP